MKFNLRLPQWGKASAETEDVAAKPDPEPGESRFGRLFAGLDRRRALRIGAIAVVAVGAGQMVKGFRQDAGDVAPTPTVASASAPVEAPNDPAPILAATAPAAEPAQPDPASLTLPALSISTEAPGELSTSTPDLPAAQVLATSASTGEAPDAGNTAATPVLAADCPVKLDLAGLPSGLINVTLEIPCLPNARIVLAHEGLAVTGLTSDTGQLFATLPALSPEAVVEARLPGGLEPVLQTISLPDVQALRRFAVQWSGNDAFQIQAYEGGAAFATPGHVRAESPGMPGGAGGYLLQLGDPAAPLPLLAEVYTWPLDVTVPVEVQVESAVTDLTCGRELVGEVLARSASGVILTDLALAMPPCESVGEFVVLGNLLPELVALATTQ